MITIKHQPDGAISLLRFVVGQKVERPVQIAVFEDATSHKVVAHKDSLTEKVTVWRVLGFGRTAADAKAMAAQTAGPDFFCVDDMGCNARFAPDNQVAA